MTRTFLRDAPVGAGFFLLAAIALVTTRLDGGIAFLWIANAFLITVLLRRRRRDWHGALIWAGAGSMLATGTLGAGWMLAPALAAANLAESVVAAYLMRRWRASLQPLASLRWTGRLVLAAGVAGPLVMALVAMVPMLLVLGQPPEETLVRSLAGHGFCNLTFVPIMKLFATGHHGPWQGQGTIPLTRKVAGLFALQAAITMAVFAQDALPLLFLPMMPIVAIAFLGDSRHTALSLLLLAVIGGFATLFGSGPLSLIDAGVGARMQFLQFYLWTMVLTIVPIASQQRRNLRLVRQLAQSEARYRLLADHSSDIIAHTDLSGRVLFASPSIERIGGYRPRDLEGRNILDVINPDDHPSVSRGSVTAATTGHSTRFEYRARTRSGEWRWFESVCRGVEGADGSIDSLVSIVRDVSERRAREDELAVAAMTDSLTKLPNRRAFRAAVQDMLARPEVQMASLAIIDIDHFKEVNDRHGHDVGDEVLIAFAGAARRMVRRQDVLARIGGEEFAILLPGLDVEAAVMMCDRLRAAIAKTPILTARGCITMTVSGGVVALDGEGLDAALRRADLALYAAKSAGRDCLKVAA